MNSPPSPFPFPFRSTIIMKLNETEHIIMFAYSFYGHQKPMCDLAVKIVRSRLIHLTILVGDNLYDKMRTQIKEQIEPKTEDHLLSCIRLVGIDGGRSGFDTKSTNEAFASAFQLLASGKPLRRRPDSEDTYDALPSPTMAVVDLLGYEALLTIRRISGDQVRVYTLQTSMAAQVFLLSAPKELGGRGDFAADLEREAEAVDLHQDAIIKFAQQVWERTDGKLIGGAGLPEIYDYELYPQLSVFGDNVSIAYIARFMHRLFNECDGVILNTSYSIEPNGIAAWKRWLGERPVFALGPLAPPVNSAIAIGNEERAPTDVENFLDDALLKHGENSVVYLSFGTVFWTTEPEKVWTVLDVLMELGIPFVFAHASPVATIPEEVREKVNAFGLGFMSKWIPQHIVLHHRATGWFLSHCGQNSMLESLMEGVPMICWPFRGDQPCNAINLSVNLNVAYELFEVRNGEHGLAPLKRLGDRSPVGSVEAVRHETLHTFLLARGDDGEIKRANAERIKDEMAKSWEAGGSCRLELEKLLNELANR